MLRRNLLKSLTSFAFAPFIAKKEDEFKTVILIDARFQEKIEYTYNKDNYIVSRKIFHKVFKDNKTVISENRWNKEYFDERGNIIRTEQDHGMWENLTYDKNDMVLTKIDDRGNSFEYQYNDDKTYKMIISKYPQQNKTFTTHYTVIGDRYNTRIVES